MVIGTNIFYYTPPNYPKGQHNSTINHTSIADSICCNKYYESPNINTYPF